MGRGGGQAKAAPPGRHTRANAQSLRMSLRAMKSAHEPVVVGLARIVQEQPATSLAGIDQHKYA